MNAMELALKLSASGGPQVSSALKGIAKESQATSGKLKDLGNAAQQTQQRVTRIGGGAVGLAKISAEADKANASINRFSDAMGEASNRVDGIKRAGVGMAVAGGGALLLANHLKRVSEEGRGVQARLEGVLQAQGRMGDMSALDKGINAIAAKAHAPDDDPYREAVVLMANWNTQTRDMIPLLEAAGRQAGTTGQSVQQMANAFAKAIETGSWEMLKKSAVSFSEAEKAAINAGYAVSEYAGKQALTKAIIDSVNRTTGELGSNLTASAKAASDAARAMDSLQENVGKGAADADAKVKNLAVSILSLGGNSKEAQEGAGAILQIGGYAATAAGGVLTLAGNVMQVVYAKRLLALAQAEAARTAGANVIAQRAQAGAIALSGNAAAIAAPKMGILARMQMLLLRNPVAVGVGLGIAGYEGARAVKGDADGDGEKDMPGTLEAAGNAVGRIGSLLSGGGFSGYDNAKRAEQAEEHNFEKENERRMESGEMPLTIEQFRSGKHPKTPKHLKALQEMMKQTDSGAGTMAAKSGGGAIALAASTTKALTDAERQAIEDRRNASRVKLQAIEDNATLESARLKKSNEQTLEREKDELEKRLAAIDKAKDSGRLSDTKAQEQTRRLRDAFDTRRKTLENALEMQTAEIEARAIREKTAIEAATQTGSERTSTLALGGMAAKRIMELARIGTSGAPGKNGKGSATSTAQANFLQAQNLSRLLIEQAGATKDPGKRSGLLGDAGRILDSAKHARDWGSYNAMRSGYDRHGNAIGGKGNTAGGQRLAVGADIGWNQTTLANGDIQLTLRSEPIVIKQASLTGRF